ncbi:MAG: alpha-amylase family protein [Dongiaceae bacterium]
MSRPAARAGRLRIDWTDAFGRQVDRLTIPVAAGDGPDIAFRLDMRRAVSMRNELQGRLEPDGAGPSPAAGAALAFVVAPDERDWWDYHIIAWQPLAPAQYATLRAWGVTAGMVFGNRSDGGRPLDPSTIAPLLDADLRWYVENIATDFYAAYHRWSGERPVNWRFLEVQQRYREQPADGAASARAPSLSDPAWLERIRARLGRTVRAHAPYAPLYYSLADEPGIADLAAFWDFDLSAPSLAAMRRWLAGQYGGLAALNAEWGTGFRRWDQVVPMTTREAMGRTDGNFAAWADWKAWMDVAFARALRAGTDAIHGADPAAVAGIEGGQVPGWGGYDYANLAEAVDLIELYDFGSSLEIARSLNPRLILLTTIDLGAEVDPRRVWMPLIRGSRGLILWNPAGRLVGTDGSPGPVGVALAPTLRRLAGGLGALLIGSEPEIDPVAILYSPASFRTQWMLDHQPLGEAWSTRSAGDEYEDDALRSAVRADVRALRRSGLQYRFISAADLSQGALGRAGVRALLLPHAIAMSPAEAAAIRRFVAGGGLVIADVLPGAFDQHSRKLPDPPLADLFRDGRAVLLPQQRADRDQEIARRLAQAGLRAEVAVADPTGAPVAGLELHLRRNGDATVIAMAGGPAAADLVVTLDTPRFAYDLLAGRALGRSDRLAVTTSREGISLIAVSPAPLRPPVIAPPQPARAGDTVALSIAIPGAAPGARRILHADVIDSAGAIVPCYSRNLIAAGGAASLVLPLALNDPPGRWRVRVSDLLSGATADADLAVEPR